MATGIYRPKFVNGGSRKEAFATYPEAVWIIKVVGGWMVFFSLDQLRSWNNHKWNNRK
jgi:hypothetical protein